MAKLFKDKYRIQSIRLKHWDYSSCGAYYITICTKNRECFFGDIVDGKMILSNAGGIVYDEWFKTKQLREHVNLDAFVVMPNHIHGIVIIDHKLTVETHGHASLQHTKQHTNKFGPQCKNLSSMMRGFKGSTTKQIKLIGYHNFKWQPRFYEHIIRNESDMNRIREYIINNPLKWKSDLMLNIRLFPPEIAAKWDYTTDFNVSVKSYSWVPLSQ